MVVDIEMSVRRQEDGQAAADSAVLHRIVQQDDIQVLQLAFQLSGSAYAVFAHSNRHVGELTVQLHRLVAYRSHSRVVVRHHETVRLALVASGEDGRLIAVSQQQPQQVLHHRRLARSPRREVTHTNSRHLHGKGREQTLVIEQVTYRHACGIEPTERYFNE